MSVYLTWHLKSGRRITTCSAKFSLVEAIESAANHIDAGHVILGDHASNDQFVAIPSREVEYVCAHRDPAETLSDPS